MGSFGYLRALAAGSTAVGEGTLLTAVEVNKYDGPWQVADDVRKVNGVLRYSQGTATDGLTLSAMAYSNGWNSTDQVPQRAIDQGLIDRLGSLDPTDGGTSSRFSLSGNWAHSSEFGQSNIAPMSSARHCGSSIISPTFSTIPSTAISSASWIAAP